jgi:hypothetical protein
MSGLRTAACAGRGFRGVAACAFLGTIVLASFAAGGSAGVVARGSFSLPIDPTACIDRLLIPCPRTAVGRDD